MDRDRDKPEPYGATLQQPVDESTNPDVGPNVGPNVATDVGFDDTYMAARDSRSAQTDEDASVAVLETVLAANTDSDDANAQTPLVAGSTFGQYQLIRELGRGGMGAVYLARDLRLGRRVAVKFLARSDGPQAERFLAEARATARCKHENIIDIHDVGEQHGHSYMVLEYIKGTTLRAWIGEQWHADAPERAGQPPAPGAPVATNTPVSQSLAADMMIPVVRALVHAHAQGLVHRDLKPENIMLADTGTVKVLDFGIAKALEEPEEDGEASAGSSLRWELPGFRTNVGTIVGTMPYMSPEQWRGQELDGRSDIWAVGIILWELITGRHPLTSRTSESFMSVADAETSMPSMVEDRPDLRPLASIIDRCLRKAVVERIQSAADLLAELERLTARRSAAGADDQSAAAPANPYVALAAFQPDDADRFFGRDRDITRVMGQLRNRRMVTVAGASGAGKSSLIRAGVIPALQRSGQKWESYIARPGRRPMAALAGVLQQLVRAGDTRPNTDSDDGPGATVVAMADKLMRRPGRLGAALRARSQRLGTHILLFVDQFEELYTLGANRAERSAFVAALEGVADDASSPLRVALSMRSDFFDRVAEDRAFTSELTEALTLLAPMQRTELRQALVRPLEPTGYRFESGELIDTMLDALEAARAPLPLLQFTAAQLWEQRDRERQLITVASYEQLGGIAGALASHADAVLAGLSASDRALARMVCTALVSDQRTRAIVGLDELRARVARERRAAVEQCVQRLARARLVLMESDDDGSTVELVHESLIERWPALVRWLDEDQEASHFRAQLHSAARQWDQNGRTDDLLWRGQAARDAGRWLKRDDGSLVDVGERDLDYLRAVVAHNQRARTRRRRLVAAAFVALCGVAIVVAFLAVRAEGEAAEATRQARRADRESRQARDSAARARSRAAQARNASRLASATLHRADTTLALALLREMEPEGEMPPHWRELARWATHQDVARVVLTHESAVNSAAFSPDGTRVATASRDRVVRLWRADGSGQPTELRGHTDMVYSAAFSSDGQRIVTASRDKTARVWNADGSGEPIVLSGHQQLVNAAGFNPDGTRVVTASWDRTARVWNLESADRGAEGIEFIELRGHRDGVSSAAFSLDGARIVTASKDHSARVWNSDGSGQPIELTGHRDGVQSAAFSPDGTRIVTGSWDHTARIWNSDGRGASIELVGHGNVVYTAVFSPDGTRVVTASWDHTARVWNSDGRGASMPVTGHQARVSSAVFSPDGARIITASWDKTARIWAIAGQRGSRARPIKLADHQDPVALAAFSPDGSRIVTAALDKTARIWKVPSHGQLSERPIELAGHENVVYAAAFSPDGRRVITASWDKTARVWNADGSGEPIALTGHEDFVYSAMFSLDGSRVVTGSGDHTARVWNADGSGAPLVLKGHRDTVYSASFSRDGARVVTASYDHTARVWNADGSSEPVVLKGHQDRVYSASFSPDGQRILTTSGDNSARVWQLAEPRADGSLPYVVLSGHEGPVIAGATGAGAFSPDGARVVTISNDKTLRIWRADGSGRPAVLSIPDLDTYTVAFSPDGSQIVTAAHSERDPSTGKENFWVTIWPSFEPFTGVDDPALWSITSYCPPVALRQDLLGVPKPFAEEQLRACQRRVAAAR